VKQHSEDAPLEAAMRADAMLVAGHPPPAQGHSLASWPRRLHQSDVFTTCSGELVHRLFRSIHKDTKSVNVFNFLAPAWVNHPFVSVH
jgi:hypothetical protein